MQGELLDADSVTSMKLGTFWSGGDATGCGTAFGHSGGGGGYKTNVWVSGDGSRVAVVLLNGRLTDSDRGDGRAGAALQRLYCATTRR